MRSEKRLRGKIYPKIKKWVDKKGREFTICFKEFCQGNRASLFQLDDYIKDLGIKVFVVDGLKLDEDLLWDLEYRLFDLIGKYSSTPGGEELLKAIETTIVDDLTDIFISAKRKWNFYHYKLTESLEEIDPNNSIIPTKEPDEDFPEPELIYAQAQDILGEFAKFARRRLRGPRIRLVAFYWLKYPERSGDFEWLAAKAGTSPGAVRVILTRFKQKLLKAYSLERIGNRLVLHRID